jgi:hypothetical protein
MPTYLPRRRQALGRQALGVNDLCSFNSLFGWLVADG